jgi:hypothetical protein
VRDILLIYCRVIFLAQMIGHVCSDQPSLSALMQLPQLMVDVLCLAAVTARLDMLMMLQPCRRLMRSVNLSLTTVCTIRLVFLAYQLSKAILQHAAEAYFAIATSVTKRTLPVCFLTIPV